MSYSHHKERGAFWIATVICFLSVHANSFQLATPSTSLGETQRITPALASRPEPLSDRRVAAHADKDARGQIRIGSGDLLEITVYGTDFAKTERVASNGNINLPLVGEMHVAGLTVQEAESAIHAKLIEGEYFNDPEVSVFQKEYATQGISVLGEVQKPGVYPLLGPRALRDAISMAGGQTARAGKNITVMHRDSPTAPVTVDMSKDSAATNIPIYPGDTIEVHRAAIVYVVGDVHLPGGFIAENDKELTVLQAVALAQGANSTASLDNARILRKASGHRQDIPINLKQILASKAPDLPLQSDDIVFVPTSAGKNVARRGLEAILQTATGVAIYRR